MRFRYKSRKIRRFFAPVRITYGVNGLFNSSYSWNETFYLKRVEFRNLFCPDFIYERGLKFLLAGCGGINKNL
ncbi:MAG: hypothetical protein A3C38_06455 [Planctomycetes bacterium RIFCSPHIGHO2_02_FULL_50_42]|nr:MAG: hypothetical protein A3C38_06455 [Planctomycetes bacterium RIFCSPHIGHO2_02_FULL_50_42]OHB91526.1 MAG: hypothetical protein A3E75_03070 [Planctomycetes bacterium RIFCSPHIGHO2_12_FULL_51_37]OHC03181.1 MAG: hypothetical protein A3G17_04700 [Planctomycetes bacterium RIFCSPLOWO2_12_FULL_50_35]